MVITVNSGSDWSTVMTAFGTVGAVLAAVGIAIWSNKTTNNRVANEWAEADRRLREQLAHSDAQLMQQQKDSRGQLAEERAWADERLRRDSVGFVHAWVERDPKSDRESSVYPPKALRYVARNDGSVPVYNVSFLAPMFYGFDQCLVMANISVGMLIPGQMEARPAPAQMNANYISPSPIPILFTDSKGDKWERDSDGNLAELDPATLKLDKFLIQWDTAPKVNFKRPGIADPTVLFFGQEIAVPAPESRNLGPS